MRALFSAGCTLATIFCLLSPRVHAQLPAQSATQSDSARPLTVTRATDAIRQWRPHQHLYVKGNLGVSTDALDALEQWLDQQGTNWVVVLAENAQGETYTDADGQSYQGVEAVNHALGKGLMNQTTFSQQTDPRTQERNAAFFILFLKERKLSYYGSDAQDRRGLGEDHWPGKLDQPAVSAMRNGGRVVDAVKDTITQINRRLETQIVAEINSRKERAAAELAARNQALEQARAALENAGADYSLVEAKCGEFIRQHSSLTGDFARPDLAGLRAELKSAQEALARGDTARVRKAADAVRQRSQAWVRMFEEYPANGQKLENLAQRLSREKGRRYASAASPQLQMAQSAIEAARHEYERGDSSYVASLGNASNAVIAAERAVSLGERLAAQRKMLWVFGLLSTFAGVTVVGLLLNRRRLPAKTEARQLYDLWEKALSEKTSALFGLLDRRATLVGTSAAEAAERYAGETLKLGEQVIRDVDELFIMSSSAGRILQQAQALLEPPLVWKKVGNLFLAVQYRRSIGLLRDHPIEFRPEEGVELVVGGARTERDRLIGELASFKPFTMTFNELMAAFNLRAQRALASLDEIEHSLQKAPDTLRSVQKSIDQTRATESEVTTGTAQDKLFALPQLFSDLMPAAQRALSDALKRGISDPVGALRGEGERARQQSDDAAALVNTVREARQNSIPLIRQHAAALAKSGPNAEWLEAGLRRLSQQADEAVTQALRGSAAKEIGTFREGLASLEGRAAKALELDQARREISQPQIAQSASAIDRARKDIGTGLGLAPGEVLRERGKDPTDSVTQAQAQWEAAFAALERGDLDAVQNALDAVAGLTSEANQIVATSSAVFSKHKETLASLHTEAEALAGRIPEHAHILAEIQNGYAPTVLALGAGDAAHPNANGVIADNIQETESHLAHARRLLDQAASAFREARLLESDALLEQAGANLETGRHRLLEIAEKNHRLIETDAANRRQLETLQQQSLECGRMVQEPTAMTPTIRAFEDVGRSLEAARRALQATIRDPFTAAEQLAAVKSNLDRVADLARCDKDVHAQAGRSLAAAASQLAEAERLTSRAASDRVPDSPATQQAAAAVRSLSDSLQVTREEYQRPHGDWHAIDQGANGLTQRAAAAAATLRGELESAQAAMTVLTAASTVVRTAGAWTGGFGVAILGTPGADLLTQARGHLERGDYESARRLAENARRAAEQAIAQAEAEVRRRRRAEEERLEQERRRRRAEEEARQSRSSGSSGWGGGSSSWGRSGSGARTSSFSSGSGVSTSSW
jgi:hypothetical protein